MKTKYVNTYKGCLINSGAKLIKTTLSYAVNNIHKRTLPVRISYLFFVLFSFQPHYILLRIMFIPHSLFIILTLCFICSFTIAYDVAVYGATPGGIAAAITAARALPSSAKIALIEPTYFIGGMSTGGGLGLRDLGYAATSMFLF